MGELRRRVRSWPFGTPFEPVICIFCALSDAPISVANGRDPSVVAILACSADFLMSVSFTLGALVLGLCIVAT